MMEGGYLFNMAKLIRAEVFEDAFPLDLQGIRGYTRVG